MWYIVTLAWLWCRIWNPFVSIYYRFRDSVYYEVYTSQDTPSDDVTDFHETLILYVIRRANAEFQLIFALAFAVLEIYEIKT